MSTLLAISPTLPITLASWVWRPAFSPVQIGALVAVLLALAVWSYWRGVKARPVAGTVLFVMRLALLAVIGLLLMGPSEIRRQGTQVKRPGVTLLLDTSTSMRTADMDGQSRIAYAAKRWFSTDYVNALSNQCDLTLRSFNDTVGVLPPSLSAEGSEEMATGKTTHVARNVAGVIAQTPPSPGGSTLVVISDGRDAEGEPVDAAAAAAGRAGMPIHTVCIGAARNERDVSLTASPMQDYFIVGEPGKILATVFQAGCEGAEVDVTAMCADNIVTRRVRLGRQAATAVEIPITHSKAGMYEYMVSVSPVSGETVTTNNAQPVFVEVTDRRMNVLLLEGQPYWDTKFIAEALRRDERIRVTQLTQLSDDKTEAIATRVEGSQSPPVPRIVDEFAAYDVVILGRGMEKVLTPKAANALVEYVSTKGGQVIFARGLAYDNTTTTGQALERAFSAIEPVEWEGAGYGESTAEVGEGGRSHPALAFCSERGGVKTVFGNLPGFLRVARVGSLKPATTVLVGARPTSGAAAGEAAPAMVAMNYGSGGVLAMLGEGYFRWALRPARAKQTEGFADALWANVVRWMVLGAEFRPDEQVSLRLTTTAATLGDTVRADVAFRFGATADRTSTLRVTDPTGAVRTVSLHAAAGRDNRLRAEIDAAKPGVYEVALECTGTTPSKLIRKFNVMDMDLERLRTSADPTSMRELATKSGGTVLKPDRPNDLLDLITRQREAQLVPPKPEYVWDSGLVLVGILLWAGAEWIARRRGGLL